MKTVLSSALLLLQCCYASLQFPLDEIPDQMELVSTPSGVPDCFDNSTFTLTDISMGWDSWPWSYSLDLGPSTSCYKVVGNTAYADWDVNSAESFTATTTSYTKNDLDECTDQEFVNTDYTAGNSVFTERSSYPYTNRGTCAYLFLFENKSTTQTVNLEIYTNQAMQKIGSVLLGAVVTWATLNF